MKRKDDGIDVQGKSPAFFFYPGDWLRDLRPCSAPAKGVWADFLCYMHFAKRRGYLETSDGRPYSETELARMTGTSLRTLKAVLAELGPGRCGIYSRDENGVIFSRRIVRDSKISEVRRVAAKSRLQGAVRDDAGQFAPANAPANDPAKLQQNTVLSLSLSLSPSGNTPTPLLEGDEPVTYKHDELYQELCDSAVEWGAAIIEEDRATCYPKWCLMDGEQRALALRNLQTRIDGGADPAYFRLDKYLDPWRCEYKRPWVQARSTAGRKSAIQEALDRA